MSRSNVLTNSFNFSLLIGSVSLPPNVLNAWFGIFLVPYSKFVHNAVYVSTRGASTRTRSKKAPIKQTLKSYVNLRYFIFLVALCLLQLEHLHNFRKCIYQH